MGQSALVLEDDMLCRTFLCEILRAKDIDVTCFPDPVAYFEATEKKLVDENYDYILTDNQMPGMTGLEFLKRFKSHGGGIPATRFALISGSWSDTDLQFAEEIGCQTFSKPYDVSCLYQWLEC